MSRLLDQCEVCGESANQRCARCHVAVYCNKQHQREHWPRHKTLCTPYVIQKSASLGRFLTAARDFSPGEIIIKDVPLVLGPRQITAPVCVGCSTPVDGSHSCLLCGWPVCDPECQQVTLHQPECQASRSRGSKVAISKFFQLNEMYECLTPLRCLWLKKTDPIKWQKLIEMESHIKQRKETKATEMDKSNVIDFVRGYLKFQDFTDEEMYKICGILDVNGFEIPGPHFIGLYGKACLLEHSCVPNSSRTFDAEMNVVIRAAVDIRKGDHITTSYTDPMWGTSSRQMYLTTTKYFECQCQRCLDPTEFGTHFSSIKCVNCSELVAPPLQRNKDWCCTHCKTEIEEATVTKILKYWGEKLADLRGSISESEDFLKTSSIHLSSNHHYRVDVKKALAQLMGKQGDTQLKDLNETDLNRKIVFCEDVLKMVNILLPGLTRLRGLLQFECGMSMWELHRRQGKAMRGSKRAAAALQAISLRLQEAENILSLESPLQEEYQMARQAGDLLQVVTKAVKRAKK